MYKQLGVYINRLFCSFKIDGRDVIVTDTENGISK